MHAICKVSMCSVKFAVLLSFHAPYLLVYTRTILSILLFIKFACALLSMHAIDKVCMSSVKLTRSLKVCMCSVKNACYLKSLRVVC